MSVRKYWTFAILGLLVAAAGAFLLIARPDPKLATAAGQGADSKAPAGAEAAIRKANADYAAALVAGNLDAIMAFWSSDADYIDEAGEMTRGNEKIADLFRKALPEFKDTKVNIKVVSLRFLRFHHRNLFRDSLMAIRYSQVLRSESPRKPPIAFNARRNVSWTRSAASSPSPVSLYSRA